jgi:hypothetical protein
VADQPDEEARGISALEDELRSVHVREDQTRDRMRKATDVFGLLGFGLALVGLIVVAALAAFSFASNDTGVAMLFSALTIVALPIVGIAAWHAFSRLYSLSRELSGLRRREADLYARLQNVRHPGARPLDETRIDPGPPGGLGGLLGGFGRGPRRVEDRLPPGRTVDGYRQVTEQNKRAFGRSSFMWLLVAVSVLFLIFVMGVALGTATTSH